MVDQPGANGISGFCTRTLGCCGSRKIAGLSQTRERKNLERRGPASGWARGRAGLNQPSSDDAQSADCELAVTAADMNSLAVRDYTFQVTVTTFVEAENKLPQRTELGKSLKRGRDTVARLLPGRPKPACSSLPGRPPSRAAAKLHLLPAPGLGLVPSGQRTTVSLSSHFFLQQ